MKRTRGRAVPCWGCWAWIPILPQTRSNVNQPATSECPFHTAELPTAPIVKHGRMQIDGCRFCCSSQHGGAQCKRVMLKFPDVRRLYLCDTRLRRHTSLREWMRMAARAGSVHHCGRCSSVGGAGILQFVGGVTTQAVTSANPNGKRTQRKYNMQFVNQYGVWKVLQPTWQLVEAYVCGLGPEALNTVAISGCLLVGSWIWYTIVQLRLLASIRDFQV